MTAWTETETALLPLIDEAYRLREKGDLDAAARLCRQVIAQLDVADRRLLSAARLELGHLARLSQDHEAARREFAEAVTASPRWELASLALFHSLLDLDRWKEALKELLRFVSLRDSAAYRELLSEGFGTDLALDLREIANRARARLNAWS
jgi:hypothetical protein